VVLGLFLVVVAVRKSARRPGQGEQPDIPKWMRGTGDFRAYKSFLVGVSLGGLNPKNIAVAVAAAVAIATAELAAGQQVVVIAMYVLIASLGVTAPIVAAVALGDRSPDVLGTWKEWLNRNNGTVTAVIYLLFGVVLIGKGIARI
jgi:threonine/homoserine/homoserine lactone efflux protein